MSKKTITIFRLVGMISISQALTIKVDGKDRLKRVNYTGGASNGKTIIGGRYISEDPQVTEAIKNSERFKDGQIVIESEKEVEDNTGIKAADNPTPPNPNPNGADDPNADPSKVSEATNQQQAKEFLKLKGEDVATVDAMTTNPQVIEFAKSKGYSFPKWEAFNK